WNGTDDNGRNVASGIYFYKFKTDNFNKTKKMLLLK
ncbi:MAG: T9SS type A sorting domain-containing protein, partial [Candidatus Cloacimonetes bacterium]|nr:T9SS type A sorting domain-containing protein [Candidatus Cloacimonadota bacterium]